jgi:hypothetical protein
MHSRLSLFGKGLMEASRLAAGAIIPLFLNISSVQTFEPAKVFILRFLALVSAVSHSTPCGAECAAGSSFADTTCDAVFQYGRLQFRSRIWAPRVGCHARFRETPAGSIHR